MNELINAVKRSALGPAQKTGPDTISGRYLFTEDFPGFSGHFPGYPILPAVVQLIAAQCVIEEHRGGEIHPASIRNAKFLQEIRPGKEITIQCTDRRIEGALGSRIEIYSEGKTAASFFMTFTE